MSTSRAHSANNNGWADCAEIDNGDGTMTWQVRPDTQIQPAIHISSEGDTIKLGAGVFNLVLNQSIDLSSVGVRLCGTVDTSGTPATRINSIDASVIRVVDNPSPHLSIENLELHGNTFWSISRGGGIYCDDSQPLISNCFFNECSADNGNYNYGGAIFILAQLTELVPTITGCAFSQNHAEWGGAIYFYRHTSSPSPVIMSISSCLFEQNMSDDGGGAIYMYGNAGLDMEYCTFRMNASPGGSAGSIENCNSATTSILGSIFCAPTYDTYYRQHFHGTWTSHGGNCCVDDCTDSDDDGIPDECQQGCAADFDCDGVVSAVDLTFILQAWGTPLGDLNGDGTTSGADITILLQMWGACGG